MKLFSKICKWESLGQTVLVYYSILIICAVKNTSSQLERAVAPKEENAMSLWLIARTGWVYCERAGVYMDKVEQRFNEVKCKKCYMELFQNYKRDPHNLTDGDIVKCSRNFGANMIPSMPSFRGNDNVNERQLFPAGPLEFFRQINPLETVGVRAFTCNSEVSKNSNLRMDRVIMPAAGSIFQLFSTREFTSNNDTKREFPRKSYVSCLFGKLFETELALCPINTARRRCALQQRQVDEDNIFSTNIPISYDGFM